MTSSLSLSTPTYPKTILGGYMITVGTAVGAGMFSLPVVSAGMWFSWSIVYLLVSWFCMYQISLMILEVNLNFKIGDSFDTMVRGTLGKGWSIINGLAFAFLLYILDYAYISGGGSIVTHTLVATTGYAPPQMISGLMFALFFSFIVWLSTRAVARVITILIVSMVITFILATSDLFLMVDIAKIVSASAAENQSPFIHFLFAALPYYLTAFGFYSVVPSLVKLYGKILKSSARVCSQDLPQALSFIYCGWSFPWGYWKEQHFYR